MWENRCKVALSGVGFSPATRSAETPLAAHALVNAVNITFLKRYDPGPLPATPKLEVNA